MHNHDNGNGGGKNRPSSESEKSDRSSGQSNLPMREKTLQGRSEWSDDDMQNDADKDKEKKH